MECINSIAVYNRIDPAVHDEDEHRQAVSAYLEDLGLSSLPVLVFEDRTVATKRRRPALERLKTLIKSRKLKRVLVLSWSKVASNATELIEFADLCEKCGVSLESMNEPALTWKALASHRNQITSERCLITVQKKRMLGLPLGYWTRKKKKLVKSTEVPNTEASR